MSNNMKDKAMKYVVKNLPTVEAALDLLEHFKDEGIHFFDERYHSRRKYLCFATLKTLDTNASYIGHKVDIDA